MDKIKNNIEQFIKYIENSEFKNEITDLDSIITVEKIFLVKSMFDINNIDHLLELIICFVIKKDMTIMKKYKKEDIDELKQQIKLIFEY